MKKLFGKMMLVALIAVLVTGTFTYVSRTQNEISQLKEQLADQKQSENYLRMDITRIANTAMEYREANEEIQEYLNLLDEGWKKGKITIDEDYEIYIEKEMGIY